MKEKLRVLIVFLLLSVIISCNPNWGDLGGYRIEYDSGIEYYVMLDQGDILHMNDDTISAKKKGTLVKFHKTGSVDSVYAGREWIIVPPFIDKNNMAYNNDFILVDQKPLDEIFQKKGNNYLISRDEETLRNSTIHSYWIICKKSNDVYGPLSGREFNVLRNALKIPKNLTIKVVN